MAAATLAAAEFHAARNGTPRSQVARGQPGRERGLRREALFTPVGWTLPDIWDPIAGNYQAQDGWIRLHTNYAYHRAAVERVLRRRDRESVRAAVRDWKADDLEAAVVAAGGCAAAMHARQDWLASPRAPPRQAPRCWTSPSRRRRRRRAAGGSARGKAAAPYAGHPGARLDPRDRRARSAPGSWPPTALTCSASTRPASPRCPRACRRRPPESDAAFLDLTTPAGRAAFERLVATADVLVTGLRADALGRLGYDEARAARR